MSRVEHSNVSGGAPVLGFVDPGVVASPWGASAHRSGGVDVGGPAGPQAGGSGVTGLGAVGGDDPGLARGGSRGASRAAAHRSAGVAAAGGRAGCRGGGVDGAAVRGPGEGGAGQRGPPGGGAPDQELGQEGEVDFGEFHIWLEGVWTRAWMFVMRLSASGRAADAWSSSRSTGGCVRSAHVPVGNSCGPRRGRWLAAQSGVLTLRQWRLRTPGR